MRVMLRYQKLHPMRYVSHLDLMTAFRRAFLRAEIPIAYSEGFHPHPIMACASALPVGATSDMEYMDIALTEGMEGQAIMDRVNAACALGMCVNGAWEVSPKVPSFMAMVRLAAWRIPCPGATKAELEEKLEELLRCETIVVEKQGKNGLRMVDIRPGIESVWVESEGDVPWIMARLDAGSESNVQPTLLVKALWGEKTGFPVGLHRTQLWGMTADGHALLENIAKETI